MKESEGHLRSQVWEVTQMASVHILFTTSYGCNPADLISRDTLNCSLPICPKEGNKISEHLASPPSWPLIIPLFILPHMK